VFSSAPDGGELPPINAFTIISNGIKVGGSAIGSPQDIKDMLDLAVQRNIKPWIQQIPLKDANRAVVDLHAGKARYRYVLVNEKHAELTARI
jgi:alcohol dehydrogenase (NADP+)